MALAFALLALALAIGVVSFAGDGDTDADDLADDIGSVGTIVADMMMMMIAY
jgi:hypothetical protein